MINIILEQIKNGNFRATARHDGASLGYLEGNDAAHILKEMMYQAASHHLNPSTLTYDKRYVELNEAAKKYVSHKITI